MQANDGAGKSVARSYSVYRPAGLTNAPSNLVPALVIFSGDSGQENHVPGNASFRDIAKLLTDDAPVIPYHFGANVKGLTPNVEGFVHRADGLVRYVDIGLSQ